MKSEKFNFANVVDFEKHIELSIPNFQTLDSIFVSVCREYAQPESIVLDLGCSTGRFLSTVPKTEGVRYIGVDTVDFKDRRDGFEFVSGDIEEVLQEYVSANVSVVVCMFMLQFLGKAKRKRITALLQQLVRNGAILLISEKIFLEDSKLQTLIHRIHIQEKRKGFTDKEILDKDNQLSVSMFCKTEHEIDQELREIGTPSKVWQSYNFMGYVITG